MKRYLFVLLLIVSIGLLVAVESAPSATVGYVKYPSVAGLNLVAMPMNDGVTLTSQIGDAYAAQTYIDAINLWLPGSQSWNAALEAGGYWDPDLPVGPGSVLMLSSSAAFDYYSIGGLPVANAQYNLISGLNLSMVPLNHSELALTSDVGNSIDALAGGYTDAINLWLPVSQSWNAGLEAGGYWDPDLAVAIGTPMFISYTGPAVTWPSARGAANTSTSK
jgi:hypothetical protein